jgi:hypothetical protein
MQKIMNDEKKNVSINLNTKEKNQNKTIFKVQNKNMKCVNKHVL